jgi:ABC-type multidrug transport system ATPase subunit
MSEQILKALMQLFAIIARPQSNRQDRRTVVENFLRRQLNAELVQQYLKFFDEYYAIQQQKQSETARSKKRTAASSVRVLLICTELNEELTQKQKIFILVQLLEFVKSDIPVIEAITDQELEFLTTVSDQFKVPREEFDLICEFVLYPLDQTPTSNKIVVINNKKELKFGATRHIYSEALEGQVIVLQVASANMFLIRYMGHSELYLNGQLLSQDKVFVFTTGSSIRNPQIKPIYFSDVVEFFYSELRGSKIVFEVNDIEYKFQGGKVGLHKMSFTEESGHLVGIMGASGAGKSTLLGILNGSSKPSSGEVFINGININTEKKKIEGIIGFVSQDDLLIEELTVFENLYYNAKLCFDNYTDSQVREMVIDTLQNFGLQDIKDMKVGSPLNKKISGGQRKRLNIALELIREPGILFLDEPTSGLSSRDSENIMDLLKELSFKGKLVFVVIHQPSSDIFKMFDKLLILDFGGYLIYNGDPIDSIIYFKSRMHHANWNDSECHACGNVNPEQVFNIVESRMLDEYGKLTYTRKISPKEWSQYYVNFFTAQAKKLQPSFEVPHIYFKIPSLLKQFFIFVKRDILSKISNTQYLIINFFEAPLLAFILSYLIKYFNISSQEKYSISSNSNLPVYIFMSVIVAIFIGLSVSAEEIIKDRKILKREAFLNLSWLSYLLSKIAVLFLISAIQALTFVLVGNSIIQIKGMFFAYWIVLFSAWAASNVIGLVISDSFKTVVTIYILIPFLVIPQIILSGVIVKFDNLNPALSKPHRIPIYGEIITARWAYEALAVYQFMENDYERLFYSDEKAMSIADYKKTYWVRNLKNKIEYLSQQLIKPEDINKFNNDLQTLRNEITKENGFNPLLKFKEVDQLTMHRLNADILANISVYLDKINKYYIKFYNKANAEKDSIICRLEKTPAQKEQFLAMKMNNYNDKLTEFVTNSHEVDIIVEYHKNLYQKKDPIYLDPESKFIKAQFYAPRKMVFGKYIDTIWVNIGIIWLTTLISFIVLYFRLLKRSLDRIEQLGEKVKKSNE